MFELIQNINKILDKAHFLRFH